MAKAPLGSGDYIQTTLGINMPLGDDRGSPWIKTEVSASTKIRKKETYKHAVARLNRDVKRRLDRGINYLLDEMTKKAK